METLLKLDMWVLCIVSAIISIQHVPIRFQSQKLNSKIPYEFRNAETQIEMYKKLCKLSWDIYQFQQISNEHC